MLQYTASGNLRSGEATQSKKEYYIDESHTVSLITDRMMRIFSTIKRATELEGWKVQH